MGTGDGTGLWEGQKSFELWDWFQTGRSHGISGVSFGRDWDYQAFYIHRITAINCGHCIAKKGSLRLMRRNERKRPRPGWEKAVHLIGRGAGVSAFFLQSY